MIPPKSQDIPEWLRLARMDLGIREGRDDARILAYRQFTKLRPWAKTYGPGSPWCSDAVCAWLEKAGVRSSRSAGAASYLTYGRECACAPGAIFFVGPHDPDAGASGHVGLVNQLPVGRTFQGISGNCGNSVKLKNYAVAGMVFRWPEFP